MRFALFYRLYYYRYVSDIIFTCDRHTPNPRFLRPRSLRFRFLRTRHYLMKVSKVQCPNHYITITLIFAPSIFALPIFGGPNVRKNRGFGVSVYLISDSLACGCNLNNSKIQNCDSNGKCTCKEKYSGFKCTDCASGYIGYPECQGLF